MGAAAVAVVDVGGTEPETAAQSLKRRPSVSPLPTSIPIPIPIHVTSLARSQAQAQAQMRTSKDRKGLQWLESEGQVEVDEGEVMAEGGWEGGMVLAYTVVLAQGID